MTELTIEDIKRTEFTLLQQIKKVCENQKIDYSIIGGTLLGAVRHHGFIPWDDDIDIIMPRKSYNQFIEFCAHNDAGFDFVCHELNSTYYKLYGKVSSRETCLIEENANRGKCTIGVNIDVFPVDGLGETKNGAFKLLKKTKISRELLVAANWTSYAPSLTHHWIYEPLRFTVYLLSRIINPHSTIRKIEKTYIVNDLNKCKYAGAVCGAYRNKEVFPSELFREFTELEFEGEKFKAIKQYDKWLTQMYGDYMKLPPENKRTPRHDFMAYWKTKEGK